MPYSNAQGVTWVVHDAARGMMQHVNILDSQGTASPLPAANRLVPYLSSPRVIDSASLFQASVTRPMTLQPVNQLLTPQVVP